MRRIGRAFRTRSDGVAIRRSVEEGHIWVNCDKSVNSDIIKRIWNGEEIFDSFSETKEMTELLNEKNSASV